jgi:RimJ/RimL family protein N-acetyltransferase
MNVPVLETERLFLKEATLAHAGDYQKYFNDFDVIRFLSFVVPWPYPEDGAYQHLKNTIVPKQGKERWMWGIFLKNNPEEFIGAVELWKDGNPDNRGFWLGKKFWGQGIMTEACEAITQCAFMDLGFEKLVFSNAKGNMASRRIKEKAGACLLDVIPFQFASNEFDEAELWELSKRDWLIHVAGTQQAP